MTETTAEAPAQAASGTPKAKKGKAAAGGSKKAKTTPSHPPVAQMVNAAIKALKERGGSSTQAIKKYISSTYKIDAEKKSQFIRKYLKSAVVSGKLVQTKGKGASGSFKLAGSGDSKSTAAPKAKKTGAGKSAAGRPKAATKSKAPAKKAAATAASPKAKKTKKPPTAAKSPKPKVAKAKPAPSPKKAKKPAAPKKTAKKPAAKKASPKKK